MLPLSNRMIVTIFPELTETAAGLVTNEAVETHNDSPAWARVEKVGPEVTDIAARDIIMFSRFAGVNLNRRGTRRIMSRDEVMMVAEPSDEVEVTVEAGDEKFAFKLLPGAELTFSDSSATVLGILSAELPQTACAALAAAEIVFVTFDDHDENLMKIKASGRTLIKDRMLVARGHKLETGAFFESLK